MRTSQVFLLGALALAACNTSSPPEPTPEPRASSATPRPPPFEPKKVTLDDKAMGTHVVITTYTTRELDEAAIRPKLDKALAEIRRLERLMTTWRDDSEISRINQAAGKQAVAVGPETFEVIKKSISVADRSEGVFDISFEAMRDLWRFDENKVEEVPSKADLDAARALIDYRKIKLDHDARSVMLSKPGMRVSLGGIAKGYAVDAAAKVLAAEGLASFYVQAGGDLYVRGKKPDGSPYRVGVRDPRGQGPNDYFAMIDVTDHSFSTAGDYERAFVKDGKRWHHIIDPRTGYPARKSRSVTVWAKDAFTADGIDDAIFILGPDKGLSICEELDDCGAVVVDEHNKVWVSKRLESKIQMLRDPTDGV
ncbi:FAD:protein FMN transferase [Polyangium mundeleinium]|uniref:FAD:protein FMN transferase n=1 Tax=Polyangium mundeleinium TaxID=2995306 RepID=A0ABT5F702_9BACT|nr:FAD:protein FMN transferase [Polyangium mundeleinium]MDC0749885.1 FAD:protein FMN transferase [Polyangium mundeleinium]